MPEDTKPVGRYPIAIKASTPSCASGSRPVLPSKTVQLHSCSTA